MENKFKILTYENVLDYAFVNRMNSDIMKEILFRAISKTIPRTHWNSVIDKPASSLEYRKFYEYILPFIRMRDEKAKSNTIFKKQRLQDVIAVVNNYPEIEKRLLMNRKKEAFLRMLNEDIKTYIRDGDFI